jgi:aryl-alcohol dehydrogenase-like predicted oxidoreductase
VQTTENLTAGDFRLSSPRFQGENFQKNLDIVEVIQVIAAKHGVTPAQVALAWVLAQGEDILPIPGTKRVSYLEQNLAAAELQLDSHDLAELGKIHVHGARYSEENQRYVQE